MKRKTLSAVLVLTLLALAACGGGGSSSPTDVTQILSDPAYDGDISQDTSGAFTITQGMTPSVQSVFAGVDPPTGVEYRAFLDFPLSGAGGVPGNAVILSAVLDIVINSISPNPLPGTIPIRIDLVSFQPPDLLETDFSRSIQPSLATTVVSPPISAADFGGHVPVDVTFLMQTAQQLGLPDFQVRILEDLGAPSPGLIEITDTTGPYRAAVAPLLQVTYY